MSTHFITERKKRLNWMSVLKERNWAKNDAQQ